MELPDETRALLTHASAVVIILGVDSLIRLYLPLAAETTTAGLLTRWILDWGAVALIAAVSFNCLMKLISYSIDSGRAALKAARKSFKGSTGTKA